MHGYGCDEGTQCQGGSFCRLVAFLFVHNVFEWLSLHIAVQVLDEELQCSAAQVLRRAGTVGAEDNVREVPQRTILRAGLDIGCVQAGAGQLYIVA